MPAPDAPEGRPALLHYLLLYAAAALWIDFGHIHLLHHADTLLFSLSSLYAWTPFFWEQDRVGQFVPLLTTWCSDPLTTVLMQTWLTVFMGLTAPLLVMEIVYPRPAGRAAATLASALMIAFASGRGVRDNLLFECCYPQGMTLACAGILLLCNGGDRPRWWRYLAAAALVGLAHWVYVGTCVWLLPLIFSKAVIRPGMPVGSLREWVVRAVRYFPGWVSVLLLFGGFALGYKLMAIPRAQNPLIIATVEEILPREEWPESWWGFLDSLWSYPESPTWIYASGGLALAGLAALLIRWRKPAYPLLAAIAVLALAGGTELLVLGTREWPALNKWNPRYILGTIESAQLILALVAVAPLAGWAGGQGRWIVFAAMALILFTAATVQYGYPRLGHPRADLDAKYGAQREELRAAKVDAYGGDYWVVWPVIYYDGLALPPGAFPLYGMTLRSSVFRDRWERSHPDGLRVGVPANDNDRKVFRMAVDQNELSPPVLVGRHGSLEIYFIRPLAVRRP